MDYAITGDDIAALVFMGILFVLLTMQLVIVIVKTAMESLKEGAGSGGAITALQWTSLLLLAVWIVVGIAG